MKKCFLDSNLLIYYQDNSSSHHQASLKKLSRLVASGVQLYISPLVLDEFLYAVRSILLVQKAPQSFRQLERALSNLFQIPSLTLINPPLGEDEQLKVIDYMEKFNLKPRDAYHLLTIETNDLDSFATFDTDFKKVFKEKLLIMV